MKKKILILGILSIIYILFFPFFFNNVIYKRYTIQISSIGEKDIVSKGTEIWINRILVDGKETDLSKYLLDDGWEYNGRIFSAGNTESTFTLKLHAKEKIEIEFVTHPYSGIIQIQNYDKSIDTINLYSNTESYIIKDFLIY